MYQKSESYRKTKQLHIRCTYSQYMRIKLAAKQADLTISDLIISALLKKSIISGKVLEEIQRLASDIRGQGGNLNQIARASNQIKNAISSGLVSDQMTARQINVLISDLDRFEGTIREKMCSLSKVIYEVAKTA